MHTVQMQNATQLGMVVVVLFLVLLLNHVHSQQQAALIDIINRQREDTQVQLRAQNTGFEQAITAVSDATSKAVQSITYPDAQSNSPLVRNADLPSVREMPIRERDLSLDYTDPTDVTLPDTYFRPDVAMLTDDLNGPLGIPGLKIDRARYVGDEV